MVEKTFEQERPSQDDQFVEQVMALITASEVGDTRSVEALLAQNPRLASESARPRFGAEPLTPLHNAAVYGYVDIAERLLDNGADIDASSDAGWTPLLAALMSGQDAVVALLLARGALVDIFAAAKLGDLARVKALVDADPSLVQATGPRSATPLHCAGTVPVAAYLMQMGADIDADDGCTSERYRYGTPLRWQADNPDLADFLLAHGAKIDDAFLAAALGRVDAVRSFLDADPSVLEQPKGPYRGGLLHTAADKGHVDVARLLLEEGADVNAPSADGNVTPLHLAAAGGHAELIKLLLAHGADRTATDTEFQGTPAGWAKFWGQDQVVSELT